MSFSVGDAAFVLDLDSNPHPDLLAGAIDAYNNRRDRRWYWKGYLRAMADATGATEAQLVAWVERHGGVHAP